MTILMTAFNWLRKAPIWVWLTLALMIGVLYWSNARVDAAVAANTAELKADFEQQKQQAINDEAARSRAIVAQTKEQYDAQINTIKNDAARLLDNHRTGTVRLSVPATCPVVASDGGGTQPNTDGVTPAGRAELSDDAVRFFVTQAERADQQAVQLNALIDIVERLKLGAMP